MASLKLSPSSSFGQSLIKLLFNTNNGIQVANGSVFDPVRPLIYGGLAIYPDPNTLNFIKLGYCGNSTVFTIVSKASRKFGYLPRYVFQIENKTADKQYKALLKSRNFKFGYAKELQSKAYNEQIVDNPFAELMARPNAYEGQDTFFQRICIDYMICGEAFIQINRGYKTNLNGLAINQFTNEVIDDEDANKTPPQELNVLSPANVQLIPDPTDVFGVLGYYFLVNGVRNFVRKEDMIHWKQPNPYFDGYLRTHQRGLSALSPGNKLVTQDQSGTDAMVSMQQNQGAKSVIFQKTPGGLDPQQKTKLEGVIDSKINNPSRKGAVATVWGDWGSLDLGQSAVDMQLVEAMEKNFIRICNLFDIPAEIFINNTTFNNTEQAIKSLITGLLLPMSCSLRDEMNRALIPAFGLDPKQITSDVDISGVTELQDDMVKLTQAAAQAYWKTGNEKREMTNDERMDDPNMDKVLVPNNLIDIKDAVMDDGLDSYKPAKNTDDDNATESGKNQPDQGTN